MARWRVAKAVAAALLAASGIAIPATAAHADVARPCYPSIGTDAYGNAWVAAWCSATGSGRVRAKAVCATYDGITYTRYGPWVYNPGEISRAYCNCGDKVNIATYELQ